MKTWAVLLFLLLAGCASAPRHDTASVEPLFDDASFAPPSRPVTVENLFALSDDMRAYLRQPAFRARLKDQGNAYGLVEALYAKGELKLEYESTFTRTAAQTFEARSGNCLSLVIMTAAFARELGMPVRFQSVAVEESWTRAGDLYFIEGHVNLRVGPRFAQSQIGWARDDELTVDFVRPADGALLPTRPLDEGDIVAMYMNNRAAESLAEGRVDDAYWWARGALTQPSRLPLAYNTLGVVYLKRGDMARAERVLRVAFGREPNNLSVAQNLLLVLNATGKLDESKALAAHVARLHPEPPFHFFEQGMKALRDGDNRTAKTMFEREVRRAPENDEFHYWLAVALARLGEANKATEQLALALDNSTRSDRRDTYSAKLTRLRALAAPD